MMKLQFLDPVMNNKKKEKGQWQTKKSWTPAAYSLKKKNPSLQLGLKK